MLTAGSTELQVIAEVTFASAAVAATSELDQTITLNGLRVEHCVSIVWPTLEAGMGIMTVEVSALNTLKIRLRNFTAGAITPAAKAIKVIAH